MGWSIGVPLHAIADIYPGIITQAMAYTTSSFAAFSGVALFTQRRSMLFLGAICATMMQAMGLYMLFAWLSGTVIGLGYIMVSLFVTCAWIIFDT